MKRNILLVDDNAMVLGLLDFVFRDEYEVLKANSVTQAKQIKADIDLCVIDLNLGDESGLELLKHLKEQHTCAVLILSGDGKSQTKIACLKAGADDFVAKPFHPEEIKLRIKRLEENLKKPSHETLEIPNPEMSARKRIFDVFFAGMALICLSPIMLLVSILIKIDSKGPVFYFSKRIGAGYREFNLYKFRTMTLEADQQIHQIQQFNMYQTTAEEKVVEETPKELFDDNGWAAENQDSAASFMKFQNDPRVTRLGAFLRKSSLDELPQLINIIKGDMSIVGNRPLPLYEAEKLTKDEAVARFMAPAGLTGLWQVTKRGKSAVSETERIELDNTYAQIRTGWLDLKLIIKTIPAVFQSEKV